MKKRINIFALLIVTGALLFACNSTRLISSWKAPNATISNYSKVLVIGLMGTKDPEVRAQTEERLVAEFKEKGIIAESAYAQYGPKAFDNLNEHATFEKIRNGGYDAAFTIALLNKTRERNYNPGTYSYQPYGGYYSRFWGHFRSVYSTVYHPGYYTTSTNYILEGNFYSLSKDMLQYSAQTKSFDPGSAKKLASDLSETILNYMMSKGLLQSTPQP
jgi:hypothetical protein